LFSFFGIIFQILISFIWAAFPPSAPNLLFVVPPRKRISAQVGLRENSINYFSDVSLSGLNSLIYTHFIGLLPYAIDVATLWLSFLSFRFYLNLISDGSSSFDSNHSLQET